MSDNEYRLNQKRQEVANQLSRAVSTQLGMTLTVFEDPGQKVTCSSSVAMIGVATTASLLCDTTKAQIIIDGKSAFVPTPAHVLFASLFVANSSEFYKNGGLAVEFEFNNIIQSLDQFQTLTGRSFEQMLNPSLLERIQELKTQTAELSRGEMSKFMPH